MKSNLFLLRTQKDIFTQSIDLERRMMWDVLVNPQVVAIGEILVDFVSTKPGSHVEAAAFEKCFGGAPMNTLVGVSRFGIRAGAIAAVGDDPFGVFLIGELKRNKVDVSGIERRFIYRILFCAHG